MRKFTHISFYTEGPVADAEGNFYCTTLQGRSIVKINKDGKITEWARCACPNGQIIVENGDHLVCDSAAGAIKRFAANGQFIRDEVYQVCAGTPVGVPNDLCVDAAGGIYFTDSTRHTGKVFYTGKAGEQTILTANLDYPNGLTLSKDQQVLYVSESYTNRILRIRLTAPGAAAGTIDVLTNLPAHAPGEGQYNLPDGLTTDEEGNILVAHYGMQAVHKLSPEGKLLLTINTQLPLTSNLVCISNNCLLVSGGFHEPGPGALVEINLLKAMHVM